MSFSEDTILAALNKIGDNKAGIVFLVDEHGILAGSFSDGDFRRWVTASRSIDLDTPAIEAARRDCVKVAFGSDLATISAAFRPGVDVIPWSTNADTSALSPGRLRLRSESDVIRSAQATQRC